MSYKRFLTLILCCSLFFLSGYVTINHNDTKIVVDDEYLGVRWYNIESKTDFPDIDYIIKRVQKDIDIKVTEGTIHFDPTREQMFWKEGGSDGLAVDITHLRQELKKRKPEINLKTNVVKAKTEAELLATIEKRAGYSTRFDSGNAPRASNIKLSAQCFNGMIVHPGEKISFNEVVGKRTAERGYKEANIIMDGEFVKGIGGGVCQTSTTLFNAAILAGLDVEKSHNHSLVIGYVPLGRDAMVSSCADLVLRNNTGSKIYIEAGVENSRVFFNMYGNKLKGIRYVPSTRVREKPIKTQVQGPTPTNLEDYERIIIERGVPARTVDTYIEAYKGNKLLQRRKIRTSHYKGEEEVIKYQKIERVEPEESPNKLFHLLRTLL